MTNFIEFNSDALAYVGSTVESNERKSLATELTEIGTFKIFLDVNDEVIVHDISAEKLICANHQKGKINIIIEKAIDDVKTDLKLILSEDNYNSLLLPN